MTKKITTGNYNSTTKQQIFEAYNELLEQMKAQSAVKHDPAAEVQAKKVTETLDKAETIASLSVEDQIAALQKNVAGILGNLANSFSEEIKSFNNLQAAIDLKKAELKEIHDIEKEAFTLAALVNSHQEIKAKHDAEMQEKREVANTQLTDIQNQIAEARKNFQEQIAAEKAQLELERKREKEVYEYEFNRRKQREKDALADELAAERKEFENEVVEVNNEIAEREVAVDKRETEVKARESKMQDLENAVAAFPEQLTQARTEAAEAAKKEEQKVSAIKASYVEKDANTKVQLAENKVSLLEQALAEEKAKNAELATKLDEAYGKIQSMALASVDSSKAQNAYETMARSFGDKTQK